MSSPNTGTKQLEISDLSLETLKKIFKYLSVEERKVVKSVCKSWSECCNVLPLLDDEVLACLAIYQLSDIYELLGKSKRKFLNLKFENVMFDHGSSFWKHNGPRIRSIDFIDCQFPNGILEDIIVSCASLFHLSFIYTSKLAFMTKDKGLLPPIKDIEKISKNGIVREELKSLEMDIGCSRWFRFSDYIIHQLLMIFPRIKILKISCYFGFDLADIDINLSEATNENRITMAPALNYLISSSDQIEKVKLDFPVTKFSPSGFRCILETVSSLKRLTELCINTSNAPRLEDIDTFFCSKQLKSLEFQMNLSSDNLMLLLYKLLLPNSSLQYLKINNRISKPFILPKSLYEKLMSSGLKSFMITTDAVSMPNCDSFSSCSSVQNRTSVLPSLSACIFANEPDECMPSFLQYYQTLHHLKVETVGHNELQSLLKYQKKLRSLKMIYIRWSESIKIHPESLGFNELMDIECLELGYPPAACYFLRTVSPKPIFSKLKYLFIDSQAVDRTLFPADLLRAADAMPFLEGLHVYDSWADTIMFFDDIVQLCTKLNRLRYLYYEGDWLDNDGALTDGHYRKVFSVCFSLRVLVHALRSNYPDRKTYFFDTLKKKVVLKQDKYRYTFDRPRIGEFTVSWLDF